jgi:8-oxo-dGTP pyrophosphatase MutT (NUDIX family)
MERHFTVTGFVCRDERTALHWHPRVQAWLPPGGHIEPNEDPLQAVLREVREETGLDVRVLDAVEPLPRGTTLPSPVRMSIFDIGPDSRTAAPHQHIDLIYFTVPVDDAQPLVPEAGTNWLWVDADQLRERVPLEDPASGKHTPAPDDVRELGLMAIEAQLARPPSVATITRGR